MQISKEQRIVEILQAFGLTNESDITFVNCELLINSPQNPLLKLFFIHNTLELKSFSNKKQQTVQRASLKDFTARFIHYFNNGLCPF